MTRPFVWQMIKDVVEELEGKISYSDIKRHINKKWDNVNQKTITAQIIVLTVNHHSRIHYPENQKTRLTDSYCPYDLLYTVGRGQVEKYMPEKHGVWEIYNEENDKFFIRQIFSPTKIFTPTDIIWFKNVTNKKDGEAYLDFTENFFPLHFPTKHKTNALNPAIGELILVYQKVNNVPAFTHLVTPIDNKLIEDNTRPEYRYAREVKIIAKTNRNNLIPVSTTLWNRLNYQGITQGNVCKLKNISNIGNVNELQFDIWSRFSGYFVSTEKQSEKTINSILAELEISNPNLTVTEGKLQLISHLVKERNRKIVTEKKKQALKKNVLECEVCTFSFLQTYDSNFIECHHLSPISKGGIRETNLEDLALVCSNCHRMLHTKFNGEYLSIDELQDRIRSLRNVNNSKLL